MRKLSRRAASIALAAAMLFTTAGVRQKKVEAASTGKLSVTGYQDYNDAQKILKEVNKYRKKNGRKALKMDRGLTNSAIMRGFETTIYIPETSPHRRPNGKLSKSINKKIIYENCAQSAGTTPKQIVKGWINSSTHRKGLLLSNAKSVGVAAVTVVSRDGYEANTWVLDFSSSKAKKVEKSKARKQFTKNIVTKNSYLKKSYLKLDSRYGTIWETEKMQMKPTYQGKMMKEYGVYPTVINTSSFTSWKSSNPSVASVDSNGRITGNKAGTATISVKLKTGTKITISKKIKVVPTNQQIDPWE